MQKNISNWDQNNKLACDVSNIIDHFNTKLQGTNWDDILNLDDPQEAFLVFHSSYTNLYSDCFPKKRS